MLLENKTLHTTRLSVLGYVFPLGFSSKVFYPLLISSMRATCLLMLKSCGIVLLDDKVASLSILLLTYSSCALYRLCMRWTRNWDIASFLPPDCFVSKTALWVSMAFGIKSRRYLISTDLRGAWCAVWTGFLWLRTRTGGGPLGCIQSREFLH